MVLKYYSDNEAVLFAGTRVCLWECRYYHAFFSIGYAVAWREERLFFMKPRASLESRPERTLGDSVTAQEMPR